MGWKDFAGELGFKEGLVVGAAILMAVSTVVSVLIFHADIASGVVGLISHNNAAAWVQAIGSIIAIGVAIAVSQRQASTAREQQAEEWKRSHDENTKQRIDRIRTIARVAEMCAATTQLTIELLSGPSDNRLSGQHFRKLNMQLVLLAIDRLQIYESPGDFIAGPVLNIQMQMKLCVNYLDESILKDLEWDSNQWQGQLSDCKIGLARHLSKMRDLVNSYNGEAGQEIYALTVLDARRAHRHPYPRG